MFDCEQPSACRSTHHLLSENLSESEGCPAETDPEERRNVALDDTGQHQRLSRERRLDTAVHGETVWLALFEHLFEDVRLEVVLGVVEIDDVTLDHRQVRLLPVQGDP